MNQMYDRQIRIDEYTAILKQVETHSAEGARQAISGHQVRALEIRVAETGRAISAKLTEVQRREI